MVKKKHILSYLLFSFIILLSGCETTKGVAQGIGQTAEGITKGITKDTQSFWQAIVKADNWMKDNLW